MKEMTLEQIQKELGYEVKIVAEQEKPQKVWKPKKKEDYWYVDYDGTVKCSEWVNFDVEKSLYALGNCFRTKEEAEFYKEKLLVTAELQRFADEHNEEIDWKDYETAKHYFYYDYLKNELAITIAWSCCDAVVHFSSKEIAQKAIQTIGEESIKKYYLGVTE